MKTAMLAMILSALVLGCGGPVRRLEPVAYPDPCGSHMDCYKKSLHHLEEARLAIQQANAALGILGAVVPFFLTPDEIEALAPAWLPADGQQVLDTKSPFHGKYLPDLRDRVALGAAVGVDVTTKDPALQTDNGVVTANGVTQGADIGGRHWVDTGGTGGEFAADTAVNELVAVHSHKLTVTFTVPPPAHRKLVYMVRVRPFQP